MNAIFRGLVLEKDLPLIVTLRRDMEAQDQDGYSPDETVIRTQLARPGHNPHTDWQLAFLNDHPEQLVAYVVIWPSEKELTAIINICTHPANRNIGFGTTLLDWARKSLHHKRISKIITYCNPVNMDTVTFLENRGFSSTGCYNALEASLPLSLTQPSLPQGFSLKSYAEINDPEILTAAMNDCYCGLWGHNHTDVAEMSEWLKVWDKKGLWLLFAPDGTPAGISRTEMNPEMTAQSGIPTGYIDAPGVHPLFRSLNLYLMLLHAGVNYLLINGASKVLMESWGDLPKTLREYRHYGFSYTQRSMEYIHILKISTDLLC